MSRKSETTVTQICAKCLKEKSFTISKINLDEDKHPWVPGVDFIKGLEVFETNLIETGWHSDGHNWFCAKHPVVK